MRFIKTLLLGTFIGLLVGLWMGTNIGKGEPNLFASPFPTEDAADTLGQ